LGERGQCPERFSTNSGDWGSIMTTDYSLMLIVLVLSVAVSLAGLVWLFIRPESSKSFIARSRRPFAILLALVLVVMIGAVYVMEHFHLADGGVSQMTPTETLDPLSASPARVSDTHLAVALLQRDTDKLLANVLAGNKDDVQVDIAQVALTLQRVRSLPDPDLYSTGLSPILDQMQQVIESLQVDARRPGVDLKSHAESLLTLKAQLQRLDYDSDLRVMKNRPLAPAREMEARPKAEAPRNW
jgi:hypothetical protein